jgi:uncharacterized membrane protein YccC
MLAAFGVNQPSMRETRNRTISQVLGTLAACLVAVAIGLVVHGVALFVIGLVGTAFGLAFVMRNQFIAAAGTMAFALAGAAMTATMPEAAAGRLAATLVGAVIGVVGTILIRPPRQPQPGSRPTSP